MSTFDYILLISTLMYCPSINVVSLMPQGKVGYNKVIHSFQLLIKILSYIAGQV